MYDLCVCVCVFVYVCVYDVCHSLLVAGDRSRVLSCVCVCVCVCVYDVYTVCFCGTTIHNIDMCYIHACYEMRGMRKYNIAVCYLWGGGVQPQKTQKTQN